MVSCLMNMLIMKCKVENKTPAAKTNVAATAAVKNNTEVKNNITPVNAVVKSTKEDQQKAIVKSTKEDQQKAVVKSTKEDQQKAANIINSNNNKKSVEPTTGELPPNMVLQLSAVKEQLATIQSEQSVISMIEGLGSRLQDNIKNVLLSHVNLIFVLIRKFVEAADPTELLIVIKDRKDEVLSFVCNLLTAIKTNNPDAFPKGELENLRAEIAKFNIFSNEEIDQIIDCL